MCQMIQEVRYNIRTLLGVYLNDCLPNNLWSNSDVGLHEIPTAFIAFSFHFLRWNSGMVEWLNGGMVGSHYYTFYGEIPLFKVRFYVERWYFSSGGYTRSSLMLH